MDAPLGRGGRQRARGHRGHRDAEGPRPADVRELCLLLAEPPAGRGRPCAGLDAARRRWTPRSCVSGAGAREVSCSSSRTRAAMPSVVDDYGRFARPARVETPACAGSGLRHRASTRSASAAPRCCSALDASGWTTPIDYGAGIVLRARPGDRVDAGDAAGRARSRRARAGRPGAGARGLGLHAGRDAAPRRLPLVLDVVGLSATLTRHAQRPLASLRVCRRRLRARRPGVRSCRAGRPASAGRCAASSASS